MVTCPVDFDISCLQMDVLGYGVEWKGPGGHQKQ